MRYWRVNNGSENLHHKVDLILGCKQLEALIGMAATYYWPCPVFAVRNLGFSGRVYLLLDPNILV
jgi:hypothetical protein